IEAKLWGCSPEDETVFACETIVNISGEVHDYRGRKQLKIKSIRPTTAMDQVKISDFLQTAPIDPDEMVEKITQYIFEMKNAKIQRITRSLLQKHREAFKLSPAATKNHHEYVSGLAHHVVSMLDLAR